MSFGIKLHCWGDFALFTRPEMKVERVSYDVITPSAARGVVEAIYWKPEIRWVIDRLRVLRPIRFTSQRRNELSSTISLEDASAVMESGSGRLGICIDELDSERKLKYRQQRASLILRDVAYVIEAHIELMPGQQNIAKHLDQFSRRARSGQCFTRPYFGTRDFAADFELIDANNEMPLADASLLDGHERDLGWMLHDIDYGRPRQARFFHAKMVDGIIRVPAFDAKEVRS